MEKLTKMQKLNAIRYFIASAKTKTELKKSDCPTWVKTLKEYKELLNVEMTKKWNTPTDTYHTDFKTLKSLGFKKSDFSIKISYSGAIMSTKTCAKWGDYCQYSFIKLTIKYSLKGTNIVFLYVDKQHEQLLHGGYFGFEALESSINSTTRIIKFRKSTIKICRYNARNISRRLNQCIMMLEGAEYHYYDTNHGEAYKKLKRKITTIKKEKEEKRATANAKAKEKRSQQKELKIKFFEIAQKIKISRKHLNRTLGFCESGISDFCTSLGIEAETLTIAEIVNTWQNTKRSIKNDLKDKYPSDLRRLQEYTQKLTKVGYGWL